MTFTIFYLWSKKIHRVLMFVISITTIIMGTTGILLKYSFVTTKFLPFIDLGAMRYVHNNVSPLFTILLVTMAVTGIYMYFYPILQKRATAKRQVN
ncbi:hypothetical protein HGB07_03995 [Candidatus Roizmanbacteria bacterium]|nr:hypothetical protein [Candidatus Roizmanbacteria bacterium]